MLLVKLKILKVTNYIQSLTIERIRNAKCPFLGNISLTVRVGSILKLKDYFKKLVMKSKMELATLLLLILLRTFVL